MKREYTLLILGAITASAPWLALTPSLNRIIFTIIGLWLIMIAYGYRSAKISGKLQVNKTETPVNMPEPTNESVLLNNIENKNHERKQPTRI
jgi:hypothetical protein